MDQRIDKPPLLLIAEDDPDDRSLFQEAFRESLLDASVLFVKDGVELLESLRRQGDFSPPFRAPRTDVILLDLNMPRKDGRQALREIKADPSLRALRVVVLTTSKSDDDRDLCLRLGADAFVIKPATFGELVALFKRLHTEWFGAAPPPAKAAYEP